MERDGRSTITFAFMTIGRQSDRRSVIKVKKSDHGQYQTHCVLASHADVLRGSLRIPGTSDEPLRTSAWEANCVCHFISCSRYSGEKRFFFAVALPYA